MSDYGKKKVVAIIGTNGLPGRYGGWDQLMLHLTENLKSKYKFVVYTSINNSNPANKYFNETELVRIPLRANGVQSIIYDISSMIHAVLKRYDLLLVLGTSGCLFFPVLYFLNVNTILNPDGKEYERGKWGGVTKLFLKSTEYFGIKFSKKIISDNRILKEFIAKKYNKDSTLIEYGGDNVRHVPLSDEIMDKYKINPKQYAFKVCRIVPENNIEMILEAFTMLDYKIVIIGNWNASRFGKDLKMKYSKYTNIILLDPIYDQSKLDEIRGNCSLYIHGHTVGGTNPSLVEAMSLGLCCIVFNVDYNVETTSGKAIYFSNTEELKNSVNKFIHGQLFIGNIGNDLKSVSSERYKWKCITEKYLRVFDNVIISNNHK